MRKLFQMVGSGEKEFDDRNCPSISNYTSDEKGFVRLYRDYCETVQIVHKQFEEIQELLEKIHREEEL